MILVVMCKCEVRGEGGEGEGVGVVLVVRFGCVWDCMRVWGEGFEMSGEFYKLGGGLCEERCGLDFFCEGSGVWVGVKLGWCLLCCCRDILVYYILSDGEWVMWWFVVWDLFVFFFLELNGMFLLWCVCFFFIGFKLSLYVVVYWLYYIVGEG